MNKNLFLALLCGLFFIQAYSQDNKGYTISGNIANSKDGMKVWILNDRAYPQEEIGEPAEIKDGKFQLTGSVYEPILVKLLIDTDPEAKKFEFNILSTDFYLENSDITVTADINTMETFFVDSGKDGVPAQISGSKENDFYLKYREEMRPLNKQMGQLYEKYFQLYDVPQGGTPNMEESIIVAKQMMDLEEEIREFEMSWIRKHPSTATSIDIFDRMVNNTMFVFLTEQQIEELENLLVEKNPKKALEINEMAEFGKYSAIGNKYTDMEVVTPDGNKVNLSEFIPEGKYILLEFWDSGCKPCRGEIPHLKEVYNQYKDKGFEIVHISKDLRRSAWLKALEQEQMPWAQVGELGGSTVSMKLFCAKALPTSILLDKEGRFLHKNIRGASLDVVLQDVFGEPDKK